MTSAKGQSPKKKYLEIAEIFVFQIRIVTERQL